MANRPMSIALGVAVSLLLIVVLVLYGCGGPSDNPPTVGGGECLRCMMTAFSMYTKAYEGELDFYEARLADLNSSQGRMFAVGPPGPPYQKRPCCHFERSFDGTYFYTVGWCTALAQGEEGAVKVYYNPPEPDQLWYEDCFTVNGCP